MCHVPSCVRCDLQGCNSAFTCGARKKHTDAELSSARRLAKAPRDAARDVARCPLLPHGYLPGRAPLDVSERGLRRAKRAAAGLLARRCARAGG